MSRGGKRKIQLSKEGGGERKNRKSPRELCDDALRKIGKNGFSGSLSYAELELKKHFLLEKKRSGKGGKRAKGRVALK